MLDASKSQDAQKPHSVLYFGSHPDEENDDCWGGDDFATLQEAEAAFNNPIASDYYRRSTAFIVLDSPDLPDQKIRPNPDYEEDRDDGEWFREQRMQAAMGHGTIGWNDYEGYEEGYDN